MYRTYTQAQIDANNDLTINPEDVEFYGYTQRYAVSLAAIGSTFIVYCDNESDALDIVGDYLLENNLMGYFLSDSDCEELIADGLEDSIMYIGNNGTPINSDELNIWFVK